MAIIDPNERGANVDYMIGPIVEENIDPLVDQVDPIVEEIVSFISSFLNLINRLFICS